MQTKSEMFKHAHAIVKIAMAEQKEIKHLSAHKTYAQLFAIVLRGCYVLDRPVVQVENEPRFMWLRGM